MLRTLAFATMLLLVLVPAYGQDFQKGFDAYFSGDYATALREWRPLAEQGDAMAQVNRGLMYKSAPSPSTRPGRASRSTSSGPTRC